MNCEIPPKTKLDKILDFLLSFLKYLDKNKLEAAIFFLGFSFAMVAMAITINLDKIIEIVNAIKGS